MESLGVGDPPPHGVEESETNLPQMMFAEGEEPVGVRVLTYQSWRAINTILNALDEEEIQYIKAQLKVEKKHEAWFRFAGKPIRFSIREFAIVTGLPCGEIPHDPNGKKKKKSKEKPYWQEIFGNVEDMRVSRAVKMLRRKSGFEKDTRLKVACLAIVSSVLLSTNLKMKMLKEHVQLLGDIDEFLAFPWGRLAFNMLMNSIKKKDEISLSQNTIALQGFALALQLVIVEAVPSLTEVVQEACSSSESDSDDDDTDLRSNKSKKQTLSHAHAREVDKKSEVLVMSIIPQDPLHPVDESILVVKDDVEDTKVDNLLKLIHANHCFSKSMFKGGLTKQEVERMRESAKVAAKRKQPTSKQTTMKETTAGVIDESTIKPIILAAMKPEISKIDVSIASIIRSVKEVSSSAALQQATVLGAVDAMLVAFKQEIMSSIVKSPQEVAEQNNDNLQTSQTRVFGEHEGQCPPSQRPQEHTPSVVNRSRSGTSRNAKPSGEDANDQIINSVMESLSQYSTPPRSAQRCPVSLYIYILYRSGFSVLSNRQKSLTHSSGHHEGETQQQTSLSATSITKQENDPLDELGRPTDVVADVLVNAEVDNDENGEGSRGHPAILNRAWEAQMCADNRYVNEVLREKYTKLTTLITRPCLINVNGFAINTKDIRDIADRNRLLPSKELSQVQECDGKKDYAFTKGLADCFKKTGSEDSNTTSFYFPFLIANKHWIGICVDSPSCKIYVLDCNPGVRTDALLSRDLRPVADMFLPLLKFCGRIDRVDGQTLLVERIKGVPVNADPGDSGFTAALLMQTHALFGPDTCRCVTPLVLTEESQRGAVMLYEFHKIL
ncbi:hypothetical protein HID58_040979 [Brassica napus]|uniref:Ubiquitin-like protease family profile domain-containing protein n=1 Tax=Brassica napus TaxID=3708 RepID=A0ABQ8BB62_BRANA|nr:hypothetical protein HID58_040979 [Brassica napus]